ncbi:MAG TPA: DNA-3-methyladenine glycosylase I [Alphaproteobacteria bacterium]|nr:DNA-3-methyladenine glycosylase I [Alphaproteobacteria bacterium]
MTYCNYARNSTGVHKIHHDTEHGFAPVDDDDLFRRLMLEISQAGLSFNIVLKKKDSIYKAFDKIDRVAKFSEKDVEKLMNNPGIVRNRLKILAAIYNAKKIQELQKKHGSFRNWIDMHHPKTREEWVKIFKQEFKFTGGEILNEFMMSIGYLPGAHDEDCYMMKKTKPMYLKKIVKK